MGCLPPSDITAIFRKQSAWSDTHTHKAGNEAIQPVKDTFHTDTRTHTVKRIKHKQLFTAFTCFSKQQVKAVKA